MSDENKPLNADDESVGAANASGEQDVQSQTDSSQDASTSSADTLTKAEIEQVLGRKFPNKDEAVKTIKNLNSLVGDQAVADARKKADSYSSLVKSVAQQLNSTEEYADLYLQGKVPEADPASTVSQQTHGNEYNDVVARAKVQELEVELQKERLLKKYPEAESVLGEITDLAKVRKVSLLDAYEKSSLKNLAQAAVTPERESATVVPTGRITAGRDESESMKKFVATGDEGALQEAIKQRLYADR